MQKCKLSTTHQMSKESSILTSDSKSTRIMRPRHRSQLLFDGFLRPTDPNRPAKFKIQKLGSPQSQILIFEFCKERRPTRRDATTATDRPEPTRPTRTDTHNCQTVSTMKTSNHILSKSVRNESFKPYIFKRVHNEYFKPYVLKSVHNEYCKPDIDNKCPQ